MRKKYTIVSVLFVIVLFVSLPSPEYRRPKRYFCDELILSRLGSSYSVKASLEAIGGDGQKEYAEGFGDTPVNAFENFEKAYPDVLYKSLDRFVIDDEVEDRKAAELLVFLYNNPHFQQKCTVESRKNKESVTDLLKREYFEGKDE